MIGYDAIVAALKARSGLSLGADKAYLIEARLEPILKQRSLSNLAILADRMRTDPSLEREVVEAMTTNETLFFRDGKPFDNLRDVVLPRLHAARPRGLPLRIWSAAASTGQEAYSVAMLVSEMGPALSGRMVEIVGTDIAREPLARAGRGLYSQFEVQRGLPARLLVKYFTREENGWQISRQLRDMVRFREWNLLTDLLGLGRFDVIFCRNVLIYFDQPTKIRTLRAISRQLASDGVVYLGGAEPVLGLNGGLSPVATGHGIFQKSRVTEPVPAIAS